MSPSISRTSPAAVRLGLILLAALLLILPVMARTQPRVIAKNKAPAPEAAPAPAPAPEAGQTASPESETIPVEELFHEADRAEAAVAELIKGLDLQQSPPEVLDVDSVKKSIGDSRRRLEQTPPDEVRLEDLAIKISRWKDKRDELAKPLDLLSARVAEIQAAGKELAEIEAKWKTTQASYQRKVEFSAALDRVNQVLEKIRGANSELDEAVKPLLEAQGQISQTRALLDDYLDYLARQSKELTGPMWEKNQPSLREAWSAPAPASASARPALAEYDYLTKIKRWGQSSLSRLLAELAAMFVLWWWLRTALAGIRARAEEVPALGEMREVFESPGSIALILAALPAPLLYPTAPPVARDAYQLMLLVPLTLVMLELITEPVFRRFIVGVGVCQVVGLTHNFFFGFPPWDRVVIVIQAGLGVALALATIVALRTHPGDNGARWLEFSRWIRLGLAGMAAVLLVPLLGEVLGYGRASVFFGRGAFQTIYLSLFILALYRLLRSILIYLAYGRAAERLRSVRRHRQRIIDQAGRWLLAAAGVAWADLVLYVWEVHDPALSALGKAWKLGGNVGSTKVTLGVAVMAALALYASVLVSKLVAFALEEEVYPRSSLDTGMQNAVTQMLRYLLWFLGLMLGLGVLGVKLQNLAIIGGALSVGIGFGLQNIVNNFVSGLILLVERPIRIGDVIEFEGRWAVVRRIGIRATLIETWDRSEVIVPNGDLLSAKIVNWTHSNVSNGINIAVGVAYGSDSAAVAGLLVRAALGHPEVLKEPAPTAFLMKFGDSALEFELHCFVPSLDSRVRVSSDLRAAVYRDLTAAGIAIPFPQREIRLLGPNP
jgi:potassium-dependent mechanosensitive channel